MRFTPQAGDHSSEAFGFAAWPRLREAAQIRDLLSSDATKVALHHGLISGSVADTLQFSASRWTSWRIAKCFRHVLPIKRADYSAISACFLLSLQQSLGVRGMNRFSPEPPRSADSGV
jgi:hypothetical protein